MTEDRNCISWWYPRLAAKDVPAPRTHIVRAGCDLSPLLDGQRVPCWVTVLADIQQAALDVENERGEWFLRTGHGSGKHDWENTCYVRGITSSVIGQHIAALVEWSHIVSIMGLPHDVFAVRELLETEPLFHAFEGRMPITREFRVFIRDDWIEHVQPYWPPDAIHHPDADDYADRLAVAAIQSDDEASEIGFLAGSASGAVGGGFWSVDLLQDRHGKWWVTDMADGEQSFRWEP